MTLMIDRRTILGGLGGLGAAAIRRGARAATPVVRLRLMETSDLHMFVDSFDYYRNRPDATVGFSRIGTLIAAARTEAANTLLFDNGDIIQGSPLGDYIAQHVSPDDTRVHPIFRVMNRLGYDAITLGNHEFNFGLPFLDRSLRGVNAPIICANLERPDGSSYLPPTTVLTRTVRDEAGQSHSLRIGVIGFLPPQIMTWDKVNLEGRVRAPDIIAAAQRYVPGLRAQSDLVIALSHSGIRIGPHTGPDEDSSFHLASVPGIDVIFTGHSHRVFPGPDYANLPGIDAVRGTLNGIPAVMPGFWGSHLGVIDLAIRPGDGRWVIDDVHVEARPISRRDAGQVVALVPEQADIVAEVQPEHEATIAWTGQPIGRTVRPVNSFFALVAPDPSLDLINAAQLSYGQKLVAGTEYADLPMLSAAAPFRFGYGGPDAFVDIPAGELTLRNVADLYGFANTVVLVRMTGDGVREWLECAAGVFSTIDPNGPAEQPLLNTRVPSYNFDVIQGITARIDVSQPARYSAAGVNRATRRIVDVRFDGAPIDPAQRFIVVTNNYRSSGGGRFPGLDGSATVIAAPDLNRDAIQHFIQATGSLDVAPRENWSFAPLAKPVFGVFRGSPAGETRLPSSRPIAWRGRDADGYGTFALALGPA